jgi:phage tail tape-measure protein
MKEYYTPEAVSELINEIYSAEDAIKYLFNLPLDNADAKLRTPEMMESYSDLIAACEDLVKAYNYYLKAENYLCKDIDEMCAHIKEYVTQQKNAAEAI